MLKNHNKKDSISVLAKKLYNIGISGNLLIDYIDNKLSSDSIKYKFLIIINNYKKFIKSEEILILFCLSFIFFRNNYNLNNIYFN